eukprot:UN3136
MHIGHPHKATKDRATIALLAPGIVSIVTKLLVNLLRMRVPADNLQVNLLATSLPSLTVGPSQELGTNPFAARLFADDDLLQMARAMARLHGVHKARDISHADVPRRVVESKHNVADDITTSANGKAEDLELQVARLLKTLAESLVHLLVALGQAAATRLPIGKIDFLQVGHLPQPLRLQVLALHGHDAHV